MPDGKDVHGHGVWCCQGFGKMKNPWMKFYPSDWRADPALRMCSLAARGLWMEMLAIMHEAEPRGSLLINGNPVTAEQLAKLAGATLDDSERLTRELEENGVFSRKKNGIIYSRRIEKDENRSRKNRESGKLGGNPSLSNQTEIPPSVNPPDKGGDNTQKPEARSQKLEEEEKKGPAASQNEWQELETKLRIAAGWERESHPNLCIVGPIVQVIASGSSLELDVLPVVKSRGPRLTSRTSWNYFIKPIQEATAKRKGVKTAATVSDVPLEKWRERLTWARQNQSWPESWGPVPGKDYCLVPRELLQPSDGINWKAWAAAA